MKYTIVLLFSALIVTTLVFPRIANVHAQSEEKVFFFDRHHSDTDYRTWTGLMPLAGDKGWLILNKEIEPITLKYLQNNRVSIFLVNEQRIAYTDQEIEDLVEYVQTGGNIVVTSHDAKSRELTREFGIDIMQQTVGGRFTIPVDSDHPVFDGVDEFQLDRRCQFGYCESTHYLTVVPPGYTILEAEGSTSYRSIIAAYEDKSGGKLLVFSPTTDYKDADHSILVDNILRWMGASSGESTNVNPGTQTPRSDSNGVEQVDREFLVNKLTVFQNLADSWKEPLGRDFIGSAMDTLFTESTMETISGLLPDAGSALLDISSSVLETHQGYRSNRTQVLGWTTGVSEEEVRQYNRVLLDYKCLSENNEGEGICIQTWKDKAIPTILSDQAKLIKAELHHRGESVNFWDMLSSLFNGEGRNDQKLAEDLQKQKANIPIMEKLAAWMDEREEHATTEEYKSMAALTKEMLQKHVAYLKSLS